MGSVVEVVEQLKWRRAVPHGPVPSVMYLVAAVQSPNSPLMTNNWIVHVVHVPSVVVLPKPTRWLDVGANRPSVALQLIVAERNSVLLMKHLVVLPGQNVRCGFGDEPRSKPA
ncbi:unnamed protein product [Peronospora destructor]|uniref:Uncharacterized protein n=1 Tax=Peronospora destructor TaxID=86335 RepID=A0AAV0TB57_9STRA|nr:unnamed protein product [Peronospora destructor]